MEDKTTEKQTFALNGHGSAGNDPTNTFLNQILTVNRRQAKQRQDNNVIFKNEKFVMLSPVA